MAFSVGVQLFTLRKEMQDNLYGTLKKVKEIGYDGALTIEREGVPEDQQRIDIIEAKEYLEKLI